jgi:hypothetical protein
MLEEKAGKVSPATPLAENFLTSLFFSSSGPPCPLNKTEACQHGPKGQVIEITRKAELSFYLLPALRCALRASREIGFKAKYSGNEEAFRPRTESGRFWQRCADESRQMEGKIQSME